ncbi:MAG: hypothetical protein ACK5QJ_17775 [Microcystis sp.]|jgi:hypothetical protein|uniref:hypothetical protein n=1 Tax=Microcystis sp. TaxID=1127 RepID=UPI0022C4CBE6|nr:hypothetical protein [Microcystis sp. LE17-20D]MCZ8064910.1 hypothetical protein [Microcystis sp. LE17-20D]MCZ8273009.1 hypothetical protein [Microcystis sp. LE19-4.1E]
MIDTNHANFDLNDDGTYETFGQGYDTDGDGIADTWTMQSDLDGDGIADQTSVIHGIDTDGDGIPDTWEIQTDLDNDGIPDQQAYFQDSDGDGVPDTAYDAQNVGYNDDNIIGDPTDDMEHWHQQTYQDTCAVVSQEFILDELTGIDFDENELRQQAIDNGWYTPGGGTPLECTGNLLEAHGIPVDKGYGCSLEDIANKLDQGEKVIVGVDADEICNPTGLDEDDLIANAYGMPGQGANHAVQVIGIDTSDPNNPLVILNDPGRENGQGLMVPANEFLNAWEDSNNFMVATATNGTTNIGETTALGLDQQSLSGYYNADGTYHYNSYNIDLAPN